MEGRWEAALGALKAVDLAPLLSEFQKPPADCSAHAAHADGQSKQMLTALALSPGPVVMW